MGCTSASKDKLTSRFSAAAISVLLSTLLGSTFPVYGGNSAYEKAVADYSGGKYGQAAGEFEALKASYPSNALIRYYLGLSRQALGQLDKARAEYQWVATNGDARLKAMAQQGLKGMGNSKSYIAGSGSRGGSPMAGDYIPPFANTGSSGSSASASGDQGNTHNGAKVTKILKFTAPWCGPCQHFAPMYESVKPQFRDIQFEEIDFDTNPELRAKYNVSAIPHLVFLDSTGKVLLSRTGAPRSAESFSRLIQSYH